MAKLIPGKIRTEGIALVENNKVVILEVSDSLLYARVDECNLRYSLDDDVIFCYCDFFQKKKYCAHLAALEYYLKNAPSGKDVLKSMEEEELTSQETQELVSFGSLFLDSSCRINPINRFVMSFRLLVRRILIQGSFSGVSGSVACRTSALMLSETFFPSFGPWKRADIIRLVRVTMRLFIWRILMKPVKICSFSCKD